MRGLPLAQRRLGSERRGLPCVGASCSPPQTTSPSTLASCPTNPPLVSSSFRLATARASVGRRIRGQQTEVYSLEIARGSLQNINVLDCHFVCDEMRELSYRSSVQD